MLQPDQLLAALHDLFPNACAPCSIALLQRMSTFNSTSEQYLHRSPTCGLEIIYQDLPGLPQNLSHVSGHFSYIQCPCMLSAKFHALSHLAKRVRKG